MNAAQRGAAGSSHPERPIASCRRGHGGLPGRSGRAWGTAAGFRRGLCVLLAAAASAWMPEAHAQTAAAGSSNEAGARALFKQGNQLIEQARYVDALDKFVAAYAAWQNPKIQLNIATTLRTLGRHAEALRAYRAYLGSAEPTDERRAEVQAVIAGLEARVAHLTLLLAPEVQRVTLDGRELERDTLSGTTALAVDPGRHAFLIETAAGPQLMTFEVVAGERERISLPPPEADSNRATGAAAAPEDAGVERERRHVGVVTRLDIDGKARGAVAALGLSVPIGTRLVASAGGLWGAHAGGWVGLEGLWLDTALTPTLGVSAPVFFVDGPRLGVSLELGARWAIFDDRLNLMARGAVVHFPRVPDGYTKTAVVPSIGSELRW